MPAVGEMMRNLFGSKSGATNNPQQNPNATPQNQREQQQQNQQQQQKPPAGDSSVLEGAGKDTSTGSSSTGTSENPLDKFKDLWQPPTGADGKPKPPKEKAINIDPAKIFEFAGKQDFKKFVKPETFAAIAKGGDEGAAAFQQAIQDIGSSTFASAITASSQMMQAALEKQASTFEAGLPELFKKYSLKENLGNKNPVLKHAAAKPIVDALQSVLAQKYPDASAADLQTTAEEFLTTFASSISGKSTTDDAAATGGKGGKRKSEDWSSFLPEGY
jgi:hypothetical protein